MHDVRIHGLNFAEDDMGYPLLILDIDLWELKSLNEENDGGEFFVQASFLKFYRSFDFSIDLGMRGNPCLIVSEVNFEKSDDEYKALIIMRDGVSRISFVFSSFELLRRGPVLVKKNIQYLEFSERQL